MERLLTAANIISGFVTIAGVLGWVAALVARLIFRRGVSFPDWVLHGAGFGGAVGILFAVRYLLT